MGTLTVNVGPMFSGKSTLLIQQGEKHLKAAQRVLYIKAAFDNRFSKNEIVTHSGRKVKALNLELNTDLKAVIDVKNIDVVLIDEIQFFNNNIIDGIWWLLEHGIKVYASGLDLNYLGEGFDITKNLMSIADNINKLKGICQHCGSDSMVTAKKKAAGLNVDRIIELGAEEKYIPLCRRCWLDYGNRSCN